MKEKLHNLPSSPGVYLMKDSLGGIIYVGKSKNLKKRVQSYFYQNKSHTPKVKKLVQHVGDLDYMVTDTEFEAFMTECELIQRHKPMHNRKMKNPLAYTYIVIQRTAGLRRIEITNNPMSDNPEQVHFGPYTANKNAVEKAIQGIEECYKIACNHSFSANTNTPCLNYSLGLCLGMCLGGEAIVKYNLIMDRLMGLLGGTDRRLYEEMEQSMLDAAEQFDFERAAKYRDYIAAVNFLLNKEKVIGFTEENRNIVILEYLSEDRVKLFLIKRNTVLFSEKYTVDGSVNEEQSAKVKALILRYFEVESASLSSKVTRDEIDQAQIIYSYLQGSSCHYLIIPEVWLIAEDHTDLNAALGDLFLRAEVD